MEFEDFRMAVIGLHVVAALGFILAVYFAFKLYRETDRGWYWLSLVLSAVFFAVPQWLTFVFPFMGLRFNPAFPIITEVGDIAAGLLFTLSCYGMYTTMKHIRKKVETDDNEVKKGARARKK